MKVQTPWCPGLWPQSIRYQLFQNTAKKEASFSLIMRRSSFTATHMAALYEWQPGCAGGKAFERKGIIKELLSGNFFFFSLAVIFVLGVWKSCAFMHRTLAARFNFSTWFLRAADNWT